MSYCNGFYSKDDLQEILEKIVKMSEDYGENKAHMTVHELLDISDDLNILNGKLCMIGADVFADKERAYMVRKRVQAELTERYAKETTRTKAIDLALINTKELQEEEGYAAGLSKVTYNMYAIQIPNLVNSISRRIKVLHEQSPDKQEWRLSQVKDEDEAVMISDPKTEDQAVGFARKALKHYHQQPELPPAFQKALRKQQHEDTVAEIKASPTVVNYKKVKIK